MTGGGSSSTKVIQVTNIAPQATKDQMQTLFGTIGKIDEIRLYPTIRDVSCPVSSRICYVKYQDSSCVPVAQHLTNTVFIDRALIVIPISSGLIPDEYRAMEMYNNGTIVPGLQKQNYKLPDEVINRIDGLVPNQVVKTDDPKLVDAGLPEYPPLPVNFDARKIEETRRTLLVLDVQPNWRLEDLMDFFKQAGEVKYSRFAESSGLTIAMIEFCEQKTIVNALKLQGSDFKGTKLNLYHSTQPITKPEAKSNEAAQKEIEEAMSIVKEAQSMISAAIDPVIGMLRKRSASPRSRSTRSRSRSRRSKSRERRRKSTSRNRRSRSRDRRRKSSSRSRRSKSRERRRKSNSRSRRSKSRERRRKSKSRERRRSKSRSRSRHRRSKRSRSRGSRKRSRSREKRSRKDERRRRTRSRSSSRKRDRSSSRRSSPPRASRSKDSRKERTRRSRTPKERLKRVSEERVRDYDAEEKIGQTDMEKRTPEKSASPEKSDNMDISNSP